MAEPISPHRRVPNQVKKEVAMSDHIEDLKSEDVSTGERPPSIPAELPILPLRESPRVVQFRLRLVY